MIANYESEWAKNRLNIFEISVKQPSTIILME